ncbi:hypothetical protein EGW08_011951 [Elysia chlorotica]|uniref:Uncharacterized protein n=1 Tax=Elysia chlorotica TaxID=188477 RepID=A0A433TFB9_ELYCH|nr:hypothetical protein EGW08_011951 [Elysia chlorotica]
MKGGIALFLIACVFIAFGEAGRNLKLRRSCRQLRQAVQNLRQPNLPNVYNPASWLPHLDSYLQTMCSQAANLQETWLGDGQECTKENSRLVKEAVFLLNNSATVCSEDARKAVHSFPGLDCFSDDDKSYSLSTQVDQCVEQFLQLRYVALHVSMEAYCS